MHISANVNFKNVNFVAKENGSAAASLFKLQLDCRPALLKVICSFIYHASG